ncbi:ABC transporter permease [Oscillibacter sp.]|uniref:ABC transporter permease n=1 Tax=Oscillibacter sp. TaxID=1945593 RepID=UPI002D7E6CF4|nr:ABC transporter permease [Oscillibacter sp.]
MKNRNRSPRSLMKRLLSYLVPSAIGLIAFAWVAVPIAMAVLWSLVNPDCPWTYPDLLPREVGLFQWQRIFQYTNIVDAIKNSVSIALCTTLLCILISIPTAYAIARRDIKCKPALKIVMLLPMVFPGMALSLFLGRFFYMNGLSQRYAGVILAHTLVCLPFMLRILTASFESMPQDLIDAASNLGAGNRVKLMELYIPMVMPAIVSGSIFTFIESMQEFNLAYIIGSPSIQTIPTILYSYMGANFLRTSASVVTLILLVPNLCLLLITERFVKTEYLGAALGKM